MEHPDWTTADSVKASQIWEAYQKQHDLSDQIGQTAGIDPQNGRVWLGQSIRDIVEQRDVAGLHSPLFFERIGSESYLYKVVIDSGDGFG
ncbi:MAG: hypothetical protein O7G87_19470 [bacterium]|nr:hypothetical protein [bacterium]